MSFYFKYSEWEGINRQVLSKMFLQQFQIGTDASTAPMALARGSYVGMTTLLPGTSVVSQPLYYTDFTEALSRSLQICDPRYGHASVL